MAHTTIHSGQQVPFINESTRSISSAETLVNIVYTSHDFHLNSWALMQFVEKPVSQPAKHPASHPLDPVVQVS